MNCKYCNKLCKNNNSLRNHERLCPSNKDRNYISYTSGKRGHNAWNKGLTKETDDRVKRHSQSIIGNTNIGRCSDPLKEQERKRKLSIAAKNQGFGGYNENAGHSQKYKHLDSFGNEVCLQSSYELTVAKILDEQKIKWIRPKHLKYGNKKYFPDFYLIDYDVYLDPKNSYLISKDTLKIQKVIEENSVDIRVISSNDFVKLKASVAEWLGTRPIIVST